MTTQARALRYDTGFTGLGTQSLVFRATGLQAEHRCSADPKPASKAFLARNGLMGRHHYDCVSSIGRPRGARVVCSTCPGECAAGPDDRPDMFAGGFPCQPWSLQRQACMRDVPPHEHPLYRCLTETIAYLRRVRPRAFLLENVHGFLARREYPTGILTGPAFIQSELRQDYHVAWVELDTVAWVFVARPRVWIFGIHKDTGSQAMVTEAAALAAELQAERARMDREPTASFCHKPYTPAWYDAVSQLARRREPCDPSHGDGGGRAPRWRQQCDAARAEWAERGLAWHDVHPLRGAMLRGLAGRPRERELLEVALLTACEQMGVDPLSSADLDAAKQDLYLDVSQNLRWSSLRAEPRMLGSVCRQHVVYSYTEDRVLLAEEVWHAMGGMVDGEPLASFAGTADADARDLVGECQALPPLALASWALLVALGASLPGLWRPWP